MKRRMRDDGNLMLLAGIVVTIAFVTTALTLSQVSTLERQAVTEATSSLAAEWRFIRERLSASINASVAVDTRNATFVNSTLPSIVATYRSVEAEKGYDVVIRPATSLTLYNKTERSLLDPPLTGANYRVTTYDGIAIDWPKDDDLDDGLLWRAPCGDPTGPLTGCIGAVVLSIQMSDPVSSLHEVLVIATNTG